MADPLFNLGVQLGDLISGGVGQRADERGTQAGLRNTLLSHQSLKAMEDAEIARRTNAAGSNVERTGKVSLADAVLGKFGSDYAAYQQGLLREQEFDNRAIAADPATNALTRARVLGAVQGKPYSDLEAVGKGFTNITDDVPTVKPLSDALGLPVDLPNDIAVFEYFSKLTPEQKTDFLRAKRGIDRVTEIGGVPTNVTSGASTTLTPLSTLEQETGAAGEKSRRQARGKSEEERSQRFIDDGLNAADNLPVINRAIELLDSVKTGGIDAAKLAASNLLGVTGADEAELSNNLGKAVLSQLRSTFGAAFTEKEGARLAAIEADFGKSTEGNKRLLSQAKQIVERAARRGIDAAERSGDSFSADEIRKSLSMTLSPRQPGKPKTPTATTPSTPRLPTFATEAEAEAAGIKPGTRVVIGGVTGTWQ